MHAALYYPTRHALFAVPGTGGQFGFGMCRVGALAAAVVACGSGLWLWHASIEAEHCSPTSTQHLSQSHPAHHLQRIECELAPQASVMQMSELHPGEVVDEQQPAAGASAHLRLQQLQQPVHHRPAAAPAQHHARHPDVSRALGSRLPRPSTPAPADAIATPSSLHWGVHQLGGRRGAPAGPPRYKCSF